MGTTDTRLGITAHGDVAALDDPVGESLRGHHAHLARRFGSAVTYPPGVVTFATVDPDDRRRWDDLAHLVGPGGLADLFSSTATPPPDWEPVFAAQGRQMVYVGTGSEDAPVPAGVSIVELGAADTDEMLALVAQTRPGPFAPDTWKLGTYLGIRGDNGDLEAMAGERLRPPGWTEISAVCTAPHARGRGHAGALVTALVAHITARDERPFLHVINANDAAISVYEGLGFCTRKHVTFRGFRVPDNRGHDGTEGR